VIKTGDERSEDEKEKQIFESLETGSIPTSTKNLRGSRPRDGSETKKRRLEGQIHHVDLRCAEKRCIQRNG